MQEKIQIDIEQNPYYQGNNIKLYGFPILESFNISPNQINQNIDKYFKGYFLCILEEKGNIIIQNDLFGNFKLFYRYYDNGFIKFSDNWENLLLPSDQLTKDKDQYAYFLDHKFTLGDSTFFKEIKKVVPGSKIIISKNKVNFNSRFVNQTNKPFKIHTFYKSIVSDLTHTLLELKKTPKKIILLFSGGTDSKVLAHMLKNLNIPFIAVTFLSRSNKDNNFLEVNRAIKVAKLLKLNHKIIEVTDYSDTDLIKKYVNSLFFDKVWENYFYFKGLSTLKEIYGTDIILISGQGSDSLFSFGPTEWVFGSLATRIMINYPLSFIAKLFTFLTNLKFNTNFKYPKNKKEVPMSLLDEFRYKPVIRRNRNQKIFDSFYSIIGKENYNFHTSLYYQKIFGFIQGKDNSGTVWGAKTLGLNLIVLPFMSPNILYETMMYRNKLLDTLFPKYILRYYLLKNNLLFLPKVKLKKDEMLNPTNLQLENTNELFEKQFFKVLSKLLKK